MKYSDFTPLKSKKIRNTIDSDKFFIRVKFVRDNFFYDERDNYIFKIIDRYQPIWELKRADRKFVLGGPNVILTKKIKLSFWVRIDKKFLAREVLIESNIDNLMANAVIYELYRIQKSDSKWLMSMKDGALNCVA